jgi:hypothetical protein
MFETISNTREALFELTIKLDIEINVSSIIDHTRNNIRSATDQTVLRERLFLSSGKIDFDFIFFATVGALVLN